MEFYELMEVCMIVAFGCSWPMNVIKSYKVRTTKGKSLAFLLLIFGGWTGFSALLSFVFSCLVIWKVVIPLCLQGYNALLKENEQ